jgi:hypothetical protein
MFEPPPTYQIVFSDKHSLCGNDIARTLHKVHTADEVRTTFNSLPIVSLYCHHCLMQFPATHLLLVKMHKLTADITIPITEVQKVHFEESPTQAFVRHGIDLSFVHWRKQLLRHCRRIAPPLLQYFPSCPPITNRNRLLGRTAYRFVATIRR